MSNVVLLIEDSATVRLQASKTLIAAGFVIEEAMDGLEGLERLEKHDSVRLIICDINMPRMNGIEFLKAFLRQGRATPVMMLTTEGDPRLVHEAKSLGAKAWMLKPFKPEVLVAAVRKLTAA